MTLFTAASAFNLTLERNLQTVRDLLYEAVEQSHFELSLPVSSVLDQTVHVLRENGFVITTYTNNFLGTENTHYKISWAVPAARNMEKP